MKVKPSALVGQEGVHAVGRLVARLGWLFREQPVHDVGIDALVEVVEEERATGQLLALQIKSGPSAVEERSTDAIVFRGDPDHLAYWLSHALPVIVVVYDNDAGIAYWEQVTENTATSTGKGWKLSIPVTQTLDESSGDALAEIAMGDPYVLRLRRLRLDRGWMRVLDEGKRLFLEADEWVNKTSGRGDIRVVVENADGNEAVGATWTVLGGFKPYDAVLADQFPWAELDVDHDVYEDADRVLFELETGTWDSEDGVLLTFDDFGDWRRRRFDEGLRPYEDDGEVARWRLEARLNTLGTAFLEVDRFLETW